MRLSENMIKRICDRCLSDEDITTYEVPVPKKIYAYGGNGNMPLVHWGTECVCRKIDLCKSCSEQLMYLIADFKCKKIKRKERK